MTPTPCRQPGEIVFTLLLAAGSVFMLWSAYGISGFDSITSAGVFPMLATGVMVLMALFVLLRTLRLPLVARLPGESAKQQLFRRIAPPAVVPFTLLITGYMLLLQPLGFVVSSYLFLFLSMALLGSRRWGLNLLVSGMSLAAIYVVFHTVFSVVLPKGDWLMGVIQ